MWRNLAICLGLAPLFACQTLDPWGHRRDLEDAQLSYTQMVRWGEYERASAYVDPEARERFMLEAGRLADIRITEYEIGTLDVDEETDTASVHVSYLTYHLSTLVEASIDETQNWYFDEESGAWLVRPALAGLREGLAGHMQP
jgi:hypothetical protein